MQQQMTACPNCGVQNTANQQFCISCGAHLGGGTRQAPHVPIVTGVAAPGMGMPAAPQAMVTAALPPAIRTQDKVEVKPTWGLAWGLLWRIIFLEVLLAGFGFLVYMLLRMVLGYNSVFGPF